MVPLTTSAHGRWLIIPIETKVRELLAKTLLACSAAERGFRVILGEAHTVRDNLAHLPAGIFLDKSLAPSRAETFSYYRQLGNSIAAWCEEGLVFNDDDEYIRRKVAAGALGIVDQFFAWGPYQANLITSRFPDASHKVLQTGNPRLDLLRPAFRDLLEEEASELRKRHGKFLLINTNFSLCNHKDGEEGAFTRLRTAGKVGTATEQEFIKGAIHHKKEIFDSFIPLIRRISTSFPDLHIVIRPHPSENHGTWEKLFADNPNIEVRHEGTALAWILASLALLHNGCTTGLEAALLEHPVIAYLPFPHSPFDFDLPNIASQPAASEEAVVEQLTQILSGKNPPTLARSPTRQAEVARFLSALEGPLSADLIADHLLEIPGPEKSRNRKPWQVLSQLSLPGYLRLQSSIRSIAHGREARTGYAVQKFPGLEHDELLHVCGSLAKASGRFANVKVRTLAENLFQLDTGAT